MRLVYRTTRGGKNWKITQKADTGGLKFKLKCETEMATLSLSAKEPPHDDVVEVTISQEFCAIYSMKNTEKCQPLQHNIRNLHEFTEFWLCWNNGVYSLGVCGELKPICTYTDSQHTPERLIGFVTYYASTKHHWFHEESPRPVRAVSKKLSDGSLSWRQLTDGQLPAGALIGGAEPYATYVARAPHNGSLAPGKYDPKQEAAFVAWGGLEHRKLKNIEILCGYNAEWVRTERDRIPENSFVGGYSEVNHGPLYIGRAFIDGHLVLGKVHTLYKKCYLPYRGKEVEVHKYEVLVARDVEERAVRTEVDTQMPEVKSDNITDRYYEENKD